MLPHVISHRDRPLRDSWPVDADATHSPTNSQTVPDRAGMLDWLSARRHGTAAFALSELRASPERCRGSDRWREQLLIYARDGAIRLLCFSGTSVRDRGWRRALDGELRASKRRE